MIVNPLEARLADLARQFARRERANALLRATAFFSTLTVGLGLSFLLLDGRPVPLALPCVIYITLLVVCWRRYVRPTVAMSREQIALFLDERHPELQNLFVTGATAESQRGRLPEWVLDRILHTAREEAQRVTLPTFFSSRDDARWAVRRIGIVAIGVIALIGVFAHWDLDRLGTGLVTGLVPEPIPFTVEPGDARIRSGDDQVVWLRTSDRTSAKTIRWREAGGVWRRDVFLPSRSEDVFYFRLASVRADTEYGARVGQQVSNDYRLSVYTPPTITAIDFTCHYPDYLRQPPKPFPYSHDLSIPQGGDLDIVVHVNKPLVSADLLFAGDPDALPLERTSELLWHGRWTVTRDDSFRVHLKDGMGDTNEDASWHIIEARVDGAPVVRIREPRGDGEATRIEEIPFLFTVKDDHGLHDFGIQYETVGDDPVRISLRREAGMPQNVNVEHLLSLEDLTLEPGDYLVWSVWAEDGRHRDRFETLGDPYFLEIRPFRRTFSEAVTNEGTERGTAEDADPASRQKQIIIGTWNLRRHSRTLDAEAFEIRRDRLAKAQLDLAEEGLPLSKKAATFREAANAAAAAIRDADPDDPAPNLARALTEEQRAYRVLLQLRPKESQIARFRGGRGGGRDGDRNTINALELSDRTDFEEQATTLDQQLADTEAVRDRIDDLARRQATINRDLNDLVSERPADAVVEQDKRRLQRLLDEQQRALADLDNLQSDVASRSLDPEQAAAARGRLGQAREQMERGMDSLEQGEFQQARAAGRRARGTLDEANEELQQLSRQVAADRMRQLQERLRGLSREQEGIRDRIAEQETQRGDLAASERASEHILERKRNLAGDFSDFMNEAGELAERSAQSQTLLSHRLGDWLRRTSRAGIYEDIEKGERYIRYGAWDVSRDFETALLERLTRAADSLDVIARDAVQDDLEAMRRALTALEDLAEEESIEDIVRPDDRSGRVWDRQLRAAESLLPAGSDLQQSVTGLRDNLESLGRRYRASNQLPHRDIVVGAILNPLNEIVDRLRLDIRQRERGLRLDIPDARSVPERYRDHVAEYFRALSERASAEAEDRP